MDRACGTNRATAAVRGRSTLERDPRGHRRRFQPKSGAKENAEEKCDCEADRTEVGRKTRIVLNDMKEHERKQERQQDDHHRPPDGVGDGELDPSPELDHGSTAYSSRTQVHRPLSALEGCRHGHDFHARRADVSAARENGAARLTRALSSRDPLRITLKACIEVARNLAAAVLVAVVGLALVLAVVVLAVARESGHRTQAMRRYLPLERRRVACSLKTAAIP